MLKTTFKRKRRDSLEPESHKENLETIDDEEEEEEKKNDNKDDDGDDNDDHDDHALISTQRLGSSKNRNEKMQTPILSPHRSPRTDLSSDKTISQELTANVSPTPDTTSQDESKSKCISSKSSILPGSIAWHMNNTFSCGLFLSVSLKSLPPQLVVTGMMPSANSIMMNIKVMMVLIRGRKVRKGRRQQKDQSMQEALHQSNQFKDLKLASERQQQQKEWDVWVEDTVFNKDEVIPEDETPKLIEEFKNVDKRVLTIYDHEIMEATLRDMISNQFKDDEEYAYHLEQPNNYMENQIVWESKQEDLRRSKPYDLSVNSEERKYVLSLHKMHAVPFPEDDLEENMNC
ncbi:hypothetical protein Tco_1013578 [Tanacetum coccineum]